MLNLIKTSILGAIVCKHHQCWARNHTFDAQTDPFIPFGADLFVYLKHIGVQIIEKKLVRLKIVFGFWAKYRAEIACL